MRSRLIVLILLTLILIAAQEPVEPQAQAVITQAWADAEFGETISFYALLKSELPPDSAIIFFQAANEAHTNLGLTTIERTGEGVYKLSYTHNLSESRFRAFAHIEYRFEVKLKGGEVFKSQTYDYHYTDNRFDWNTLEEKSFRVHWFVGDTAFAQSVLDIAQSGLDQVSKLLPFAGSMSLDIYIYPDGESMQAVLHPSSEKWVAGHADPDLGVVVVALPEGTEQRLLTEQRIPHEIMHIALYLETLHGYNNLPTWLNEGLASNIELYPNPDYRILLEDAAQDDSLIPMSALCKSFPREAKSALQSYAQAASFTSYLHRNYGSQGMEKLITAYANGLDCERGIKVALGEGLTQLDHSWQRDELAENVTRTALNNLLPWYILLGAALIFPFILIIRKTRSKAASRPENPKRNNRPGNGLNV
jgi:hypothetical protein